jgi:hypothetical protein
MVLCYAAGIRKYRQALGAGIQRSETSYSGPSRWIPEREQNASLCSKSSGDDTHRVLPCQPNQIKAHLPLRKLTKPEDNNDEGAMSEDSSSSDLSREVNA